MNCSRPDDLRILNQGQRVDVVEELDGRVYETTKFPIFKDGKPNMLAGFTLDITERKQAENALRESEASLKLSQQVAHVGHWAWDTATNRVTWSDEMKRIFGLDPVTFDGDLDKVIAQSIHPEDQEKVKASNATVLTDQKPVPLEYRVIRPDQSVHTVWAEAGETITDENGKILKLSGIVQDITERKQAELEREKLIAELSAKNAELERFTYTVSHDLKSPLVTIRGFLGYLVEDVFSGNTARMEMDVQRITNATNKMQDLLHDLLELSRIGRMMNTPESIQFKDLLNDALDIIHGKLEEHPVTIRTQPDLPAVYGDRQRLTEVLQNLLDNAIKYMGDQPDPRIEIGQQGEEDGKPVFFVKDNGIGVAPEYHERIFGLFNKLDPQSDGTGVGLALIKRIVEVHGGRIWVESELGQGSTFYFSLPKN